MDDADVQLLPVPVEEYRYWVNSANTVAFKSKGEWNHPGDDWSQVDSEGFEYVMEQIRIVGNEALRRIESDKNQEKINKLVEAGISPEVARILVEQ